jgi:hypothetical protein
MLVILSPTTACAATIEEVAHCRAIPQLGERLNCFKSLKPDPSAKTENAAPAKKQDAGSSKTKDAARAKAKPAAPARTETTTKSNTAEPLFSPTPNDPATTSVDHLKGAGQPLCVDAEALAAMLLAGLLTSDPKNAATHGC